jgi:tetratricopeptide (TPR) repeat protein
MFKHALTHDVVYTTLVLERRKTLHRSVAAAIEELYPDRLPEYYETLAYHYVRGEEWAKAFDYLVKAAEKAAAAFANTAAVEYFAQALDVSERLGNVGIESIWRAAHGRSMVNFTIFHLEEAIQDLNRPLALARAQGNSLYEARALAYQGMFVFWDHQFEAAESSLRASLALALQIPDDEAHTVAQFALMLLLKVVNRQEEAEQLLPEVRQLTLDSQIRLVAGFAPQIVSLWDIWRGAFDAPRELMAAWRQSRAERDVFFGADAVGADWTEALALGGRGDYTEAIELLTHGLAQSKRVGDVFYRARVFNTLGWIYQELYDYETAKEYNGLGLELAHTMGDPETINNATLNLADIAMAQGNHSEAEVLYQRVERFARHPGPRDHWMLWRYSQHLFHSMGELALRQGDPARALAHAAECLTLAEQSQSMKNVVKGRRLRGQAFQAQRQLAEAEQELAFALDAARKVGNPPQVWKTLVALTELCRAKRKQTLARAHAMEAFNVINGVASRLVDEDLRATLLGAAEVQYIRELSRAPRSSLRTGLRAGARTISNETTT